MSCDAARVCVCGCCAVLMLMLMLRTIIAWG
jgi:hypothetical protein